jgi:hypothetical protein
MIKFISISGAALLMAWVGRIGAAPIEVSASDSGFINSLGRTSGYDGTLVASATYNYSVGSVDDPPLAATDVPRKNWFVFDLSTFTPGSITGATLKLYLPVDGFSGFGVPPDEIFSLYGTAKPDSAGMATFASELSTAWDPFDTGSATSAMTLYGELTDLKGSMGPIASVLITESDEDSMILMGFTPFGVAYLNTFAGGLVVMGGEIDSLDAAPGALDESPEFIFGLTSPDIGGSLGLPSSTPTPALFVIPEPTSLYMGLLGMAILLASVKYRKSPVVGPNQTR